MPLNALLCFNTQPPEGGWTYTSGMSGSGGVSTHSRPKAAGLTQGKLLTYLLFQHTAARRRLGEAENFRRAEPMFQHTAAQRRLARRKARIGLQ